MTLLRSTRNGIEPYECSSWAYSYGESGSGGATGPQVNRLANATVKQFPIRGDGCDLRGAPHDDSYTFYFRIGLATQVTACDPGYVISRTNAVNCVLPATAPVPESGGGAGTPDKGSIASRCSSNKCGTTLPANTGTTLVGDPINLATGNVFVEEVDYRGGPGSRLTYARYYNSKGTEYGQQVLGAGWRHNHLPRVVYGSGNTYAVNVRPDGSEVYFEKISNPLSFRAPATHTGRLQQPTQNPITWVYTRPNGDIERYDSAGRVTKLEWASGGVLTYTWASQDKLGSVSDGLGRSITFTYSGVLARPTRVTFPDQTYVDYAYSAADQLVSATHSSGTVRQYTYAGSDPQLLGPAKLLQSVINEDGQTDVAFTYDENGRGTSAAKPGGAEGVWLNYGSGITTVTNSLGYQETHYLSTASGVPQATGMSVTCGPAGCPESGGQQGAVYDSVGNMTEHVGEAGALTCTSYVANRSLVNKRIEGLIAGADTCSAAMASPPAHARVTNMQWHASKAIPTGMSQPLLVTTYGLDTAGRVTTITEQPTNDVTGAAGFSAQANGTAVVTTLTWDAQGFVTSVREPRVGGNATTTYAYDGAQNLISVTDPVGLVTTFQNYDANGRPGLITEPNGLQTAVGYDARGRVAQVNTGGAVTTYGYTPAGKLLTSTLPSGLVLTFGYDAAGRVNLVSDSQGNSTEMTLDLEGNVLSEQVKGNGGALALSRQMAYDALSRVKSNTKAQ